MAIFRGISLDGKKLEFDTEKCIQLAFHEPWKMSKLDWRVIERMCNCEMFFEDKAEEG